MLLFQFVGFFFLLFWSCSSSKEVSFDFSQEGDSPSSSTDFDSIGLWTLGEEESCVDPQESPSWWDASSLLWGEERVNGDGQPAGCLALLPDGDDWIVAGTTTTINVRWGRLYDEVSAFYSYWVVLFRHIVGGDRQDCVWQTRSLRILQHQYAYPFAATLGLW